MPVRLKMRPLTVDWRKVEQALIPRAIKGIRKRTKAGRSIDETRFARGKDGQPIDLKSSGRMLSSLQLRRRIRMKTGYRWIIGVSPDQRAKAAALHSGRRNMPARPWLGLSPKQQKELISSVARGGILRPRP